MGELGALIGLPISDSSTTEGRPDPAINHTQDDIKVPCEMLKTALVSQNVYGTDFTRYRLVSQSASQGHGQIDYTVALYPDAAKSTAAFQHLADGFHTCRLNGGRNGAFSLGEDSSTKLTWTVPMAGDDAICATNARITSNVVITTRTCMPKSNAGDAAEKIGDAIDARAGG
ncbi:sensor domain-containing protein [Mycobacterium sp. M1]|uniref:Sensor domain-containing protein n=1 Tax=Mycolicibacter acidiphilus TaxID=2835306 RepID=A0ABS5RF52_9MYCO|nr:sensor domain-containing protein [Mycolicibacter acidiphilus]